MTNHQKTDTAKAAMPVFYVVVALCVNALDSIKLNLKLNKN